MVDCPLADLVTFCCSGKYHDQTTQEREALFWRMVTEEESMMVGELWQQTTRSIKLAGHISSYVNMKLRV